MKLRTAQVSRATYFQRDLSPQSARVVCGFHIDDQLIAPLQQAGHVELRVSQVLVQLSQGIAVELNPGGAIDPREGQPDAFVVVNPTGITKATPKANSASEIGQ